MLLLLLTWNIPPGDARERRAGAKLANVPGSAIGSEGEGAESGRADRDRRGQADRAKTHDLL